MLMDKANDDGLLPKSHFPRMFPGVFFFLVSLSKYAIDITLKITLCSIGNRC